MLYTGWGAIASFRRAAGESAPPLWSRSALWPGGARGRPPLVQANTCSRRLCTEVAAIAASAVATQIWLSPRTTSPAA